MNQTTELTLVKHPVKQEPEAPLPEKTSKLWDQKKFSSGILSFMATMSSLNQKVKMKHGGTLP